MIFIGKSSRSPLPMLNLPKIWERRYRFINFDSFSPTSKNFLQIILASLVPLFGLSSSNLSHCLFCRCPFFNLTLQLFWNFWFKVLPDDTPISLTLRTLLCAKGRLYTGFLLLLDLLCVQDLMKTCLVLAVVSQIVSHFLYPLLLLHYSFPTLTLFLLPSLEILNLMCS